jgi:SAM-dependent methyltransferase
MNDQKSNWLHHYYRRYWDPVEGGGIAEARWSDAYYRRIMRDDLTGSDVVLDVGCGAGTNYAERLLSSVREVHGVELAPSAVEAAQSLGVKAVVHDLSEPLPYDDDSFDVVLCFEVLEHLFDPLFTTRETFRVLRPGGRLLVSVPNAGYFRDRLTFALRAHLNTSPFDLSNVWAGAHIRFFNNRLFKRMLKTAGYINLQYRHGTSTSIFDAFDVVYLTRVSMWIEEVLPPPLRLNFLGAWWPGVWSETLTYRAEKPADGE